MEFISMDLIGEFQPSSSKGNRYALTAVCMLTGYTFCIPLKNKLAEEIVTAWRNHIAFPFGVCRKLLTTLVLNFNMICFPGLQNHLELKGKSFHLHTGHNQMVGLRNSINFSKVVYLSIFLDTGSGMMWCHWPQHRTTGYQTSTPRNLCFLSCLVEMH